MLLKRGQRVALRAKAADVLEVLLERADEVVSKQTLRARVWGHDEVTDQSLFQAISDVRRALAPLEAVVTHPNEGYRLALPVQTRSGLRRALAASLVLLFAGAAALGAESWQQNQVAAPAPNALSLSPSLQAFTSGIAKLNAGQATQAQSLFSLALQENAAFLEARLMLGEAYLAQGKLEQALGEARRVLGANDERPEPDAHTSVAAMSLISRAQDSAGEASRALHWAFEAAKRAHRGGLACTASDMENRIDQLLAQGRPIEISQGATARSSAVSRLGQSAGQTPRPPPPDYCAKFPSYAAPPEAHVQPAPCRVPPVLPRLAARVRVLKSMV